MVAHLDGDLNCVQQSQSVTNGVSPAMSTLRDLPLLPLNEKQLADVGVAVASASKRAQLQARGLPTDIVITLEASTKFDAKHKCRQWVPSFLTNSNLSGNDWAASAVTRLVVHIRKLGNHTCIARVCLKGRLGKQGKCRLGFWNFRVARTKRTKPVKKTDRILEKVHGKKLTRRWDGQGFPPVSTIKPEHGRALVEINHPYHTKISPPIALGGFCNHDVTALVKLPLPAKACGPKTSSDHLSDHDIDLDKRIDDAIHMMSRAMNDANFYCASYPCKQQPHIRNLHLSFADGLRKLDKDLAEEQDREPHKEITDEVRAKRVLFRLMARTNACMHKGMQ